MLIGLLKGVVVGKYETEEELPQKVVGIASAEDLKKKTVKDLTLLHNSLVAEDAQVGKFKSVAEGAEATYAAMVAFEVEEPLVKEVKAGKVKKEKPVKEPKITKAGKVREFVADKSEFTVDEVMELLGDDRRNNVASIIICLTSKEKTKVNPIPFKYSKDNKKFMRISE